MKKNKSAVLCAVAATMLLLTAGCNRKTDTTSLLTSKEPVTIQIATYYNGANEVAFENLVDEFNSTLGTEEGIYVEVSSTGDMDELNDQILYEAEHQAEDEALPDIVLVYGATAHKLDELGLAVHLDDYFSDSELDEYVDAYIQQGRTGMNGELVLFPVAKSVEIMAYNGTDWEFFSADTGITEDDLTTWEGLASTAEAYYNWTDAQTEKTNDGKAFFGRDAIANYMVVGLHQLGADLVDVSGDEVKLHISRQAMRQLWENFYVPYVSGAFGQYGRYRSDDMKTGEIVALVGSSSGASFLPKEVTIDSDEPYEMELQLTTIPNFEGTDPAVIQQGAGMVVIQSDEKKQQACAEFLRWFTESENNTRFAIATSYLPVKKEANSVEYVKKVADEYGLEWNDNVQASLEVSFQECEEYELYALPIFDDSDTCRSILGNTLLEQAQRDAKMFRKAVRNAADRQEVIEEYSSEENFSKWYDQVISKLKEIVQVEEQE